MQVGAEYGFVYGSESVDEDPPPLADLKSPDQVQEPFKGHGDSRAT